MGPAPRPSPAGKDVALFVTCMVDFLYPQTGMSVVRILEHLGVRVDFPRGQTCCGQPGYNGGYQPRRRAVARHFLDVFQDSHAEVIVVPSGSCAAMIRHEFPAPVRSMTRRGWRRSNTWPRSPGSSPNIWSMAWVSPTWG